MYKISVIIPVYNVEPYLEQCVGSVLAQTLTDIEVICVDDCSKDRSYQIMQELAQKDQRVKIYHFDESRSALQARKQGVMAADSEYIMFLDADDYLEPNACELLYNKIRAEKVDILHFSSRVINCANHTPERIALNQRLLTPCQERFENKAVFNACFVEKKYFISLWNKVFSTSLCKKAFGDMEDKYLPKAQDLYSFFIIAYHAKSYLGWVTEPLHNYCFGRGVTGSSSMNLDKFERYCTQANVVLALKKFCDDKGIYAAYKAVIQKYYEQWIAECVRLWMNELPKALAVEGLEILYRYWGCSEIISCMARLFWDRKDEVALKLEGLPQISLKDRNIKTIAIYYVHFTIGGVQRVISLLAPLFRKMGYRVVIITDAKPSEDDFEVPEGVERATVVSRDHVNKDSFGERLASWQELKETYQFDVLLYNAWVSPIAVWDALWLKHAGVPVIIHAHSVFSFAVNKFDRLFIELTRAFPLMDGMVVLSEADKAFWDAYNSNVHAIPNPISPELLEAKCAKWESKALIWVARVSHEKQPWAVFDIMSKVVREVPDAKLYLLGNFEDKKWHQMAKEKGVEKNIEFCGMIHNVNDFYEKASVHLATSKYEGFLMSLLEAQAHCLPTVMFRMPNLTIGTEECGVIGVDMADCTSAANEIVKLLKNQEHWEQTSKLARGSYDRLREFDMEAAWHNVLTGQKEAPLIPDSVQDMIHTFVNHYSEGIKYQDEQKKHQQQMLRNKQLPIMNSRSYKIGRMITFIPRAIRRTLACCRDHGVSYTIKYALGKVKNKLHLG